MLKIVLALDRSEYSANAFDWAVKNLIRPADHEVTILTVLEPPKTSGYYFAASEGIMNWLTSIFSRACHQLHR